MQHGSQKFSGEASGFRSVLVSDNIWVQFCIKSTIYINFKITRSEQTSYLLSVNMTMTMQIAVTYFSKMIALGMHILRWYTQFWYDIKQSDWKSAPN